jgi:hypothetical protein
LLKRVSLIPIPVFIAAAVALAVLDISEVVAPLSLIPITHTLFISCVSFAVAYVSARSYMASGLYRFLLMGSGNLAFGLGFLASWLLNVPGGQNVLVTVDNSGTLLSSILHVSAAILVWVGVTQEKVTRRGKADVILSYGGVSLFMVLLTIASLLSTTPPFFVQGIGPTSLRNMVVVTALILFGISSIALMRFYFRSKADILWWYSLALSLIAVGQFAYVLQKSVGSPLSWTGSIATYLAGVYFLIAVLIPVRESSTPAPPSLTPIWESVTNIADSSHLN